MSKQCHTVLMRKNLERNISKKSKAERTKARENAEPWRGVKKLGSKLGDCEDIMNRKQLSNNAMNNMNKIWLKKEKLRLKMYKSLIKPVLLYNSSTWGLTEEEKKNLNSFHRRQLRKVLNVKYPDTMSNKDMYEKSGEKLISLEILSGRSFLRRFMNC